MSQFPPIDTLPKQEYCLIVHLDLSLIKMRDNDHDEARTLDQTQEEIEGLAKAINLHIKHTHHVKPKKIQAGSYLGKGQRETIADLVEEHEPNVLIFNATLSPLQQRNLEKQWEVKVIDRTALILEIFGARAQTKEGRLQVELAMLEYQKSRLVRSWTHLERQRGGAGFMGGPGETQIEIDRRLISERITRLKSDIKAVKRTRDLGRESRARVPFPIVALVGYTNAGKSTLFNHLTDADVMAQDLLFATLDPTMRKVKLPQGGDVILADTVGFIANLPTQLVAAFKSTLEQVLYADIILHVIDSSSTDYDVQKDNVIEILKNLGIDYETDKRIVEIYNKIDALNEEALFDVQQELLRGQERSIALSALTGQGLEALLDQIKRQCFRAASKYAISVAVTDGRAVAWLYQNALVEHREDHSDYIHFTVQLDEAKRGKFQQSFAHITLKQI